MGTGTHWQRWVMVTEPTGKFSRNPPVRALFVRVLCSVPPCLTVPHRAYSRAEPPLPPDETTHRAGPSAASPTCVQSPAMMGQAGGVDREAGGSPASARSPLFVRVLLCPSVGPCYHHSQHAGGHGPQPGPVKGNQADQCAINPITRQMMLRCRILHRWCWTDHGVSRGVLGICGFQYPIRM